ncbi:hypothetical protein DFH08DRAFT_861633 [Mycena albidolilacea]|uniref:F-box domain-containing protein n=1 Tax=Mycena albidolilacea TaxID=1033008 RepID=A0AAD7A6G5_9AGAR|nr:hypothetical protein DFH08DRAFT_861633 [Mycena albidolilacea]
MNGLPSLDEFEQILAEDPETHGVSDYVYDFIQNTVAESRDIYLDKIELEKLKLEISQLKYANSVLLQRLGTYCRSNYASLPDEILLAIFRNVLPPSWLLDGTKSMLPYPQDISSVDLRMKLSILAVCKSWNRAGTELLYERVTLRRITQLPVFVRVLEGRKGLGALVKHVSIDCFVPRGYSRLHERETKQILRLCSNLLHVGFSPLSWIPELPCPLPTSSCSIISLEYSPCMLYSVILPSLLHLSQTLESSTFTLPAAYDEGHPLLNFPRLEYLCPTVTSKSVVSEWLAPNLRRLWVSGFPHINLPVFEKLLHTYGPTVTSLDIHSIESQEWLDLCPLLEHLSVATSLPSLTHPRVRFINICIYQSPPFHTLEFLRDNFHALLECRLLHPGITMNAAPDIRQKTYSGAEGRVADLLEFTEPTSVNGGAFLRNDISDDYVPDLDDNDGGSDGSEYVLDEDDDGSDASDSGDAASCITVSEDGGHLDDEFYMQEDWEIGHNKALAIFD